MTTIAAPSTTTHPNGTTARRRRVRRRRLAILLAALSLNGAAAAGALGAPGDLDPTFGGTGRVVLPPLQPGSVDGTGPVAVAPGGRIVVGGDSFTPGSRHDFAVTRLLPSGAPDPSFGGGTGTGLAGITDVSDDTLRAMVLQPDGGVLLAGTTSAQPPFSFGVARLRDDGTLDPGFGKGGTAVPRFGATSSDHGAGIALQPDGAIIVAGASTAPGTSDFAVGRLHNPGGVLDPSFGSGGRGFAGLGTGSQETGRAVALQADGRILVAGSSTAAGTTDIAVARFLNPGGTPDPSFGDGTGVALARFAATGVDEAYAVAMQTDGRIVVAGRSTAGGDDPDIAVVRFMPDGSYDRSFGAGSGRVLVPVGAATTDRAAAIALQPDGRIVVAGSSDGDAAIVRLERDGRPDTSFGGDGSVAIDLGGAEDAGTGVALQADGRIVLAGTATPGGDERVAVVRLEGGPAAAQGGGGGAGGTPDPGAGPTGPGAVARPTCAGRPATIVGTAGPDRITGTPGRDVIVARGGADRILGLGGADIVCAGPGDDLVRGGAGADLLRGEAGRDRLIGGAGRDRLVGGTGRDRAVQ